MTLRIAYGRLCQETNAFSPVPSTLDDFQRLHLLEGEALAAACARSGHEVPGLIKDAELSGLIAAARAAGRPVETIPLVSAWAMPSGPLEAAAFVELRDRLLARLRAAGPVDGVFLVLHGALRGTAELPEPEEALLEAVREVVGPEVPIAVTMDLHGVLTPRKVDPTTVLCAYRTNPHRDLFQTGRKAGHLLLRALAGEVRPVTRWRSLPLLLAGGMTIDLFAPMRAIFRRMKQMERDPRVLSVSLFMCHPFNDSPDLGWSAHVTTDGDAALADRLADELADLAWSVRDVKPPPFLSPQDGIATIRRAWLARKTGTVCVVDVSDVVGAGTPGENTNLLAALLADAKDLVSYVPVRDALAVDALWAKAEGDAVDLEVGGRFDPATNPPVRVAGRLRSKHATAHFGRAVVLDLGHVQLILTELPPLPIKPSFYSNLGLSPWRADLVVVKNFFHYRVYFALVHRKSVPIRTKGASDLDLPLTKGVFNDPVYPRDPVTDWRPADRRRRGLVAAGT
ncbi:MAG: M81 family metallopeptidase [Planctomycetes bacterium]|nr:M81 family metallopeptidase [Planctomycetota bacterium]